MGGKKWSQEENKLLKKLWTNTSKKEIASIFKDRAWMSVQKQAGNIGAKRDLNHPNVSRSTNRLENLLSEDVIAYYWMGFLMADGAFSIDRGGLKLCLANKDRDHLKKYAKYVNARWFTWKHNNEDVYECSVSNKNILKQLVNKFNIHERKTYNPPEDLYIKNNDLFIAFMIGLIDGDGSITKPRMLQLECHSRWENVLNKWFLRLWKISGASKKKDANRTGPQSKELKCRRTTNSGHGYGKDKYYIKILTSNKDFMHFLKNKTKELDLPVLNRKWENVN